MLNQFNADDETVGAPELTIGSRVHTGRILSIVEWLAFAERFDALRTRAGKEKEQAADDGRAIVADIHTLRLEFLRAVFPVTRPWWHWFRKVDPIAVIAERGARAAGDAFDRFFAHQMFALGLVPQHLNTATTTSSSSTAASPAPAPSTVPSASTPAS